MTKKKFVSLAALLHILSCGHIIAQVKSDTANFESTYSQLTLLVEKIPEYGLSADDSTNLQLLEQRLTKTDTTFSFLQAKLGTLSKPGKSVDAKCSDYIREYEESSYLLRLEIVKLIALQFPILKDSERAQALKSIENAYSPSIACDSGGGASAYEAAVLLLGKPSVSVFLDLTLSPNEAIRCRIDDTLTILITSLKGISSPLGGGAFNCHSSLEEQLNQYKRALAWWQRNRDHASSPYWLPKNQIGDPNNIGISKTQTRATLE